MRLLALLLSALLLLTACGDDAEDTKGLPAGDVGGDAGDDAGDDAGGTQLHDDELEGLAGVFGADAQLEGGCAWIEVDGARYELQVPEGYTVDFAADPVAVTGPGGQVIAETGDQISADGAVNGDLMTVCQIGPVFQATSIERADTLEG